MAVATAPREATPAAIVTTGSAERGRRVSPTVVATALVVAADAMLLAALLAAYYGLRASSFAWPPRGLSQPRYLATVITMTVVMGVGSAQWALQSVRRGDRRNTLIGLGLTMVFALAIVNADWYSFGRTKFGLSSHAYGTLHHAIIGYHLLNVAACLVMLVVAFAQTLGAAADETRPGPTQAVVMFWHFTAVAWVVIYLALFIVTSS